MERVASREDISLTRPRSEEFVERLGVFLCDAGLLNELSLRRAQRAQQQSGERFDLVLTRLGLINEPDMARVLADYLGLPLLTAADMPRSALFKDDLQPGFFANAKLLPIKDDGACVVMAVADPFNEDALNALSFLLGRRIERAVATGADVSTAIDRLYDNAGSGEVSAGVPTDVATDVQASREDVQRLEDLASEAPVIRLVHDLISRATQMGASDIHLEPRSDAVHARFRLDGILHTVETLPPSLKAAVTSRIKIMAHLDIAERRLPQDGRITANVQGREIDLRVSTMPTMGGESVVLRLLDRESVQLDFAELGLEDKPRAQFVELLRQPNGIILVTGPTGSGKTTTLYTALSLLNKPESKVFTVEDPIEYELTGVNQIQVQPKIGLTFANTLRSILRQDPDIVMVGEIRDLETAQIAIQASLTGHLVLSTVHTNSAAATVARLLDMGVEDYLLASSLKGVVAQRLVRRLCSSCKAVDEPSPVLIDCIEQSGLDSKGLLAAHRLHKPVGCDACRHTGFRGRIMVSELLVINERVQECILGATTERAITDVARACAMVGMFEDGLGKVLRGDTTLDEVLRVTRMG